MGAVFIETYNDVHLFELKDGRIFVDRFHARASLEAARELVDKVAGRQGMTRV